MASAAARTVASEAAKEGPKGTFKEGEGVPPARNDAGWRTLPADVKFYNNLASGVLEYCALNNIDPLQLDFEYDDANGQVALDLYRTTVGLGAFFHVMFTDLDKLKFWWAYQRVWPFYLAGYLYEWWSELRNKADKKDKLHAIIKAKKTLRTEGAPAGHGYTRGSAPVHIGTTTRGDVKAEARQAVHDALLTPGQGSHMAPRRPPQPAPDELVDTPPRMKDEYGDYVRARKHTLRAFSVKLWRVGNKLDLLRSFANCHVLEELDLTGLLLGGRELAVFKPVLRAGLPSLKKLCLDLTEIGNAGVTEVQRGLMGNTQGVEELSFNRVCLTAAGADDVIYLVRRFATTLQTLNLEGNGLGDKGVMAIATEALKLEDLHTLDVRANCMTNKGRKAVIKMFKEAGMRDALVI